MKKLIAVAVASAFAWVAVPASAAEMTEQERTELRQRVDALQTQRAQNPTAQRADLRSDVKAGNTTHVKKAKKSKRSHAKRHVQKTEAKAQSTRQVHDTKASGPAPEAVRK